MAEELMPGLGTVATQRGPLSSAPRLEVRPSEALPPPGTEPQASL